MDFSYFENVVHSMISQSENREQAEKEYFSFATIDFKLFLSYHIQMIEQGTSLNNIKTTLVLIDSIFNKQNNDLIFAYAEAVADIFIPFLQFIWMNHSLQSQFQEEIFNIMKKSVFIYFKDIYSNSLPLMLEGLESESEAIFSNSVQLIACRCLFRNLSI